MSKCKLTVVTACLNSADTIERAIRSVLSQSYKNIEYIIIDGGSSDGTVEIIEKYSQDIACWISEPDEGIYQAMNKGVRAATGDLIGFLSSNDWYAEGALLAIAERYQQTSADVIYGDATVIDGEKVTDQDNSKARLEDSYYYMPIIHPAFFVKTSIQKKYGFDESYRIAADYKFFMQIYRDGCQFAYTHHNIIHFYLGGVSSEREQTAIEGRRASYEVVGDQREQYEEGIERLFFENLFSALDVFVRNGFGARWIRSHIDTGKDIYIFGTGEMGGRAYRYLHNAGLKIVGFLDNAKNKQGTKFRNRPVYAPEEMIWIKTGIVFISSYDYADEMETQLLGMEIKNYMHIIRADIFFAQMVKDYIRLLNNRKK